MTKIKIIIGLIILSSLTLVNCEDSFNAIKTVGERGIAEGEGEATAGGGTGGSGTTAGGAGTGGAAICNNTSYTPIKSIQELQNIENDLSGNYCLTKDIDLGSITNFMPIGSNNGDFKGTLDGQGYTIRNLNIDRQNRDNIGLISEIEGNGRVQNLTIENPTVRGNKDVGVLTGYNRGTINNIRVKRDDDLIMVSGNDTIGGLVGVNYSTGTIENSYTTGNVTGNGRDTGGLAALNLGTISNCYTSGNVAGNGIPTQTDRINVGGLVSDNIDGTISNSYATGNVNGNGRLGGLVGLNTGSNSIIENCYFDTTATGQINGIGLDLNNHSVTGITTSDIGDGGEEPFKTTGGWDFGTIWKAIGDGQWPELQ